MDIFPVINCDSESCFNDRLKAAKTLPFSGKRRVHIDVSDGIFAKSDTWIKPADLKSIVSSNDDLEFAVHLMVNNPEAALGTWLDTGIKEIIVHVERMKDAGYILDNCEKAGIKVSLAFGPETPVGEILKYKESFDSFLILAVNPGPAGQPMSAEVIPKIGELRSALPGATIEVDGGIVPETARLIKQAGADIAVSGTYIFLDINPVEAYERLVKAAGQ